MVVDKDAIRARRAERNRFPGGFRSVRTSPVRTSEKDVKPEPVKQPYDAQRRRAVQIAVRGEAKCGTYSGYMRHIKLKQPVCDECRDAKRRYRREQYAKQKARK